MLLSSFQSVLQRDPVPPRSKAVSKPGLRNVLDLSSVNICVERSAISERTERPVTFSSEDDDLSLSRRPHLYPYPYAVWVGRLTSWSPDNMADGAALSLVLLYSLAFLSAAQQGNVARGKPANASSERPDYPAHTVTDGLTTWNVNACYHTEDNVITSWLRVYLGAVYPMDNIVIYYRRDIPERFVGTTINILNSTDGPAQNCTAVTDGDLNQATATGNFSCSTSGSIVELRRAGDVQNICEVQVFASGCAATTYGSTCTPCGHCLNGAVCDKTQGACPGGCDPGWTGTKCDAECSSNCVPRTCAQTTGDCTGGCVGGWWGPKCDQRCRDNCAQVTCDQTTAACTGGCKPGWRDSACNQKCPAGTYGANCATNCSSNCQNTTCDHMTGDCPGGLCKSGWNGTKCDHTCNVGAFGLGCNSSCGSCYDNAVCDHVTGNCAKGCQAGWQAPRCLQECNDGTHGEGCTLTCGNCAGGVACDKRRGSCTACQEGFALPLCKAEREETNTTPTPGSLSSSEAMGAGVGIGIGVTLLVFIPVLVVAVIWVKRRSSQNQGDEAKKQRIDRDDTRRNTSVYYNNAEPQAEIAERGPYESLEEATRNENVPSDYEKIRTVNA